MSANEIIHLAVERLARDVQAEIDKKRQEELAGNTNPTSDSDTVNTAGTEQTTSAPGTGSNIILTP
jgi:hypothetical protein